MKISVKTKDLSSSDWRHFRTLGAGESDVSILAGINKCQTTLIKML